jgi:hypothetical protein
MIQIHSKRRFAASTLAAGMLLLLSIATPAQMSEGSQPTNTWISSAVLPGGALTYGEGHVYAVVGGEDGSGPSRARIFRRFVVADGVWEDLASTPAPIGPGGALAFVDDVDGPFVYALRGGRIGAEGTSGNDEFWRYSVADDSWENLAPAPNFLNPGGALAFDGDDWIYAMRGRSTDFWRYSISGGNWEILEDTPGQVRLGGALAFAAGHVYATQGDFTTNFWRYLPDDDEWESLTNTTGMVARGGSLAFDGDDLIYALFGAGDVNFAAYSISAENWSARQDTPADVGGGGALVHDGQGALYALRGDANSAFWRYDVDTNAWQSDLPAVLLASTPERTFRGAGLAMVGEDTLYALRGDGYDDFWHYSIANNEWSELEPAPWNVSFGGGLASDGVDRMFAFRGNNTVHFARYSIVADDWVGLDDAPENVGPGGALTYVQTPDNEYVYALRGGVTGAEGGDGYADFWRYDIDADEWEVLQPAPNLVGPGGALAWDGGDQIFALRGNYSPDFWVYSISGNAWQSRADVPSEVRFGGALTILADQIYAFSGNYRPAFWRYDRNLDSWQTLASAPDEVAAGAALASNGSDLIYALAGAELDAFWRYKAQLDPPILLGPPALGDGAVGIEFPAQQFVFGGAGPITLTVQSGQLPPGISLGPDGLYAGTPTTAGDFQFTLIASSAYGSSELQYLHRITAEPVAPTFAGPLYLPIAIQGFGYEPVSGSPAQLQATGTVPVNWWVSIGSLPDGMNLSPSGQLHGTPTEAGEFSFTVTAGNLGGVMNIPRTLIVQPASADELEIGAGDGGQIWGVDSDDAQDPFNTYYEVSRSQTIILASELIDAGVEPGPISGLMLRPSQLPGRPSLANFRVFMQQTAAETVPGSWVMEGWTQVFGPTSIPAGSLTVGEWIQLPFSQSFFWDGVSNLFIDLNRYDSDYESGGGMYVRTGLSNRTQAAREDDISWPTFPSDSFRILNHIPEMRLVQLNVAPAIQGPLGLPDGKEGSFFGPVDFSASGSAGIEWEVTGGYLPPGLELSTAGQYSGTPTEAGDYSFTVTASNEFGSQSHEYTQVIEELVDAVFEDRFELP